MYGLTSSILAGDTYKAFELAPKILAGIVNVNSPTVNDEIHAPMGGVRDSGWGRTGPDSLKEFQDVIWINSAQRPAPVPVLTFAVHRITTHPRTRGPDMTQHNQRGAQSSGGQGLVRLYRRRRRSRGFRHRRRTVEDRRGRAARRIGRRRRRPDDRQPQHLVLQRRRPAGLERADRAGSPAQQPQVQHGARPCAGRRQLHQRDGVVARHGVATTTAGNATAPPGWGFKDVLPTFKAQEDWEGGANEWRGVGGPSTFAARARRIRPPRPSSRRRGRWASPCSMT